MQWQVGLTWQQMTMALNMKQNPTRALEPILKAASCVGSSNALIQSTVNLSLIAKVLFKLMQQRFTPNKRSDHNLDINKYILCCVYIHHLAIIPIIPRLYMCIYIHFLFTLQGLCYVMAIFYFMYTHVYLQVLSVVSELKQNKKIASATHNILAYRSANLPNDAIFL